MKFHALKSLCTILISALLFTACADETKKNEDANITPPTGTNCSLTNNALVCGNALTANDLDIIKQNAGTITTLDLSSKRSHTKLLSDSGVTQAQFDSLPEFPVLDNLSLVENRKIISIDLTKFPALTKLDISSTSITSLDTKSLNRASTDYKVEYLDVAYTNLTSLDLTKFTKLKVLLAIDIPNITISDTVLEQLTHLEVSKTSTIELNKITKLTNLTKLNISDYFDTAIDLSKLTNLTSLRIMHNAKEGNTLNISALTKLTKLILSANFNNIDLTPFTNLTYLSLAGFNSLTNMIDLSPVANKLTYLGLAGFVGLTELDLSGLTKVTTIRLNGLDGITNKTLDLSPLANTLTNLNLVVLPTITTINLSKTTQLKEIWIEDTPKIAGLDLSKLINLESLVIFDLPQSPTLNLSNQAKLVTLRAYGKQEIIGFDNIKNNLTWLEISNSSKVPFEEITKLSKLISLAIDGYSETTINLANFTQLQWLGIENFLQLETLDLTKVPTLVSLHLDTLPKVTVLDLSKLSKVLTVSLVDMNITEPMDVSKLTNLAEIYLTNMGDNVKSLDLSTLTANFRYLFLNKNVHINEINLGEEPFINEVELDGFENTALDNINKIIFPKDGNVTIDFTSPDISYTPTAQ